MNQIDELIAELCPHGVAYYELGDIATTVSGLKGKTKSDFSNGNARFVSYRNIHGNIAVDQTAGDFVKVDPDEVQNELRLGDVLFTGSSENIEEVGLSSVVDTAPIEEIYFNSFCFALRFDNTVSILPGFSKYLFRSSTVRQQIIKSANGVTRINVSKPRFLKTRIPVPPLEVQRAIVEILDKFTALEAELEAELEARKKQYEHYRSQILSADKSARWIALDEVCHSISAGGDRPDDTVKGQKFPTKEHPYPVYSNGSEEKALYGFTDSYKISEKSVTISARGTIGHHAVRSPKFTPIVRLLVLIPNTELISAEFLNYILDITPISHSGGSIPQLTVPALKLIKIPLPDLQSQHKIVDALEKFDALVNDLSSGLPAEIAARRKQYEYYRDQLLTFKELAS